jgi:hypothetical protein
MAMINMRNCEIVPTFYRRRDSALNYRGRSQGFVPKPNSTVFNIFCKKYFLEATQDLASQLFEMALPLTNSSKTTNDLIQLLEDRGTSDYIGESITQLEHCLQCAHRASRSGTYKSILLERFEIDR